MHTSARTSRWLMAVGAALVAAYLVTWAQLGHSSISRSDFTAFYTAGLLLREGHPATAYDVRAEAAVRDRLIAPVHDGNIPFDNAPPAAALIAPVTLVPLDAAYRVWTLAMLAVLVAAIVIALRAAPWPEAMTSSSRAATGVIALAGAGTWLMFIQGQWGAVTALGLAIAYRDWRRGHRLRGGLVLALAAGIAKPHLALGIAAFAVGWRQRRVLVGGAMGVLVLAACSLVLVGPGGVAAWVSNAVTQSALWDLRPMVSVIGIFGSWLGQTASAHALGVAGTAGACALAWRAGVLVRRKPAGFDIALCAAVLLSLVGAPHAYGQDLAVLAPAMVIAAAWAAAGLAREGAARRGVAAVFGMWALISIGAFIDVLDGSSLPTGPLAAWALVAATAAAWFAMRSTVRDTHPVSSLTAPPASALSTSAIR